MAAIGHAYAEQASTQTTTSTTYGDITGASIASSSFTAGKKYLLVVQASLRSGTAGGEAGIKCVHGSTDFAESEMVNMSISASEAWRYTWFTVWTAVSSEGVKLQFKSFNGAHTAGATNVSLFAMNLSDNLTENTDWFFSEVATDDTDSTDFTYGGSITFTPGTASHDWLMMTYAQSTTTTLSQRPLSLLELDGDTLATERKVGWSAATSTTNYKFMLPVALVAQLTAAEHTVKEFWGSAGSISGFTRTHSGAFVLNLNKFKEHAASAVSADTNLGNTDYVTNIATVNITPTVASGNVWICGFCKWDRNNTAREGEFRLQVDNADQPANQTTDNWQFDSGDLGNDENPMFIQTVEALSAASHTIDLDGSSDSTANTPQADIGLVWAVTMELPTNAYSLTVDPGSYSVTGSTATILASRMISAAPGSYTISGAAAIIGREFQFQADPGSYAVTGSAAMLLAGRLITASPGTYTITGAAAAIGIARVFVLDPGTYSISGSAATFGLARAIIAQPGTYIITGADAVLAAARLFTADPGEYILTGIDTTLFRDRVLAAYPGAYIITGVDATIGDPDVVVVASPYIPIFRRWRR